MTIARVHLTGYLEVPPEKLQTVRSALPEHIRLTLDEPGCLSFEVMEDPVNAGYFQVSELFSTRAAFEAHQARVKSSEWGKVSAGLPRHYQIEDIAL